MSYKRTLKAKTISILTDLLKSFVSPEEAGSVTKEAVMTQLGRRTYFKDQFKGNIRLGLCYKQVRKEIKKKPNVTVGDIRAMHKLG
jgi:hypothetical protein